MCLLRTDNVFRADSILECYKYKTSEGIIMPVDPVCGIELDEQLALVHEHKGKSYYFCCNGCRRIFIKKPRKWKKNA